MILAVSFVLFILSMVICLALDVTMILPLAVGFCLFSFAAVKKGFDLKQVMGFAKESLGESMIVVRILMLIGCLTGLWRISGTVAYFVTLGISVIPPSVFLLAAFLLAAIMSFALGTSFGVTATAGVILISIARAGGINPILAAGAIFSGVYVGDRGSPAASSGNLVAVLTHTDMGAECSPDAALLGAALFDLLHFIHGNVLFRAHVLYRHHHSEPTGAGVSSPLELSASRPADDCAALLRC